MGEFPRRGALVVGSIAVVAIGIVGCTKVADGSGSPDTNAAPAYRSSVSASVSASAVTSSVRESQRLQSVTTRAIRTSCDALATTSKEAIDKVNLFVAAFNSGKNTGATEGPAITALNASATTVENSYSDALPGNMRESFNTYNDSARQVANAIGTHAATGEFNKRVDRLNDSKTKALKLCVG